MVAQRADGHIMCEQNNPQRQLRAQHINLVGWKSCFDGELESEGEDAECKESEKEAGTHDVLSRVGHEEEVGGGDHADDRPETA